jgi:ribonuclease/clavin/mitogillin
MGSLERCLALPELAAGGRIYPAHGPIIEDGRKGVADYVANRQQRVQQVVDALGHEATHGGARGLTPLGIVRRVYPKLSLPLTLAAASNVDKALTKLHKDGKATPTWTSRLFGLRLFNAGFILKMLLQRWRLS